MKIHIHMTVYKPSNFHILKVKDMNPKSMILYKVKDIDYCSITSG